MNLANDFVRDDYFKLMSDEIESAKSMLAEMYDLKRDDVFDKAWSIAWEWDHASGINEVKICFCDLVDLVRMANQHRDHDR